MKVSGFLRAFLGRQDFYYLLSLLVPLFVYNLSLKAASVFSLPGGRGAGRVLDLMLSDVFFGLGYALLWIGLFAAARKGPLRWAVVVLFHVATMLVVIVTTSAYWHFRENGTALDYNAVAGWDARDAFAAVLADGIPLPAIWGLLLAALLYAAFGPLIVTRVIERWRRRLGRSSGEVSSRGSYASSLGLLLPAMALGALSLMTGPTALAKDPLVNVVLSGIETRTAEEAGSEEGTTEEVGETGGADEPEVQPATNLAAADADLVPTSQTQKRNVVMIHLESTRARSATPYDEDLKTMPFLGELAKESLLTERTHVVVPRSSKGSTAVNCGIEPALSPGPEYEPGGIPAPCLASLLKQQGYRTVWFQSLLDAEYGHYDRALAGNYGYEEFYPVEGMDTKGFRITNSFGYEEDVMLGPSEEWLRNRAGGEPFLAQYYTGTGHYGYECLPNRYGYEFFSENEQVDRYHNCLRMLDRFLGNLFDQYKRLGLYEDTIFVLYGDHGEGFMEHGRYMHGDNPYEEGLHVPLLIHAPGWFEGGERAEGLSSQVDILPTVLQMLGYEVANGEYPGFSLLQPLPENRMVGSSCIYPYRCMASLKGTEKYIHHFGDQPDEFYDLSEDPLEERNLASERGKEEINERREELLAWASKNDAEYGGFSALP